ncbi:MAG: diacylglycerol kinase [Desulfuromonadales bacterium]|jgi:diacylglycerol kinase (ATP)|nr:diacylglycerol kinase [Desulfuromonadales bacterium]
MKPVNWFERINCAIDGILWAVKTQRHLRYHFLAALLVLFCAFIFKVSTLEFFLLILAALLVIFAELINTAIETLVDLVTEEYNELAKRTKDIAAGAVLVTSVGAIIFGYLVLSRHFFRTLAGEPALQAEPLHNMPLGALLLVIILIILLKALFGKGTPLQGGMPSGHAAVSFSVATSVILSGAGLVTSLLVLGLALMVSHSRLLLKIHNFREVFLGAVLGSGITLLLYLLLK